MQLEALEEAAIRGLMAAPDPTAIASRATEVILVAGGNREAVDDTDQGLFSFVTWLATWVNSV